MLCVAKFQPGLMILRRGCEFLCFSGEAETWKLVGMLDIWRFCFGIAATFGLRGWWLQSGLQGVAGSLICTAHFIPRVDKCCSLMFLLDGSVYISQTNDKGLLVLNIATIWINVCWELGTVNPILYPLIWLKR